MMLFVTAVLLIGASFYMLNFSLSPDPDREDTKPAYEKLYNEYPETRAWIDSLRSINALRDTFMVMPTGEKHHALYINNGTQKTAIVLHGWRNSSVTFLFLAMIYDRELGGYNIVLPDIHAHGKSDGDMIRMGWLDRKDILCWIDAFKTDTMVVHGVSMGGATTMMTSGETMPEGIKDIRFIDDCGYTCVWDVFRWQLHEQFGLPAFPLMYTTSLLCKVLYGWSFEEASAIEAVKRCPYPMLFIHGDADTFVPTEMVYQLYAAKPSKKRLWISKDAIHAKAYKQHRQEYIKQVREFVGKK